jgi:hypothetical protein
MRTTALLLIFLLTGCAANSPDAVAHDYFAKVEPVGMRVEIPRSSLKTMRVYIHPSLTRAFVSPPQREAFAEQMNAGLAGWSARATELIPFYKAALQQTLLENGKACTASNPVAFATYMSFEFTLSCH